MGDDDAVGDVADVWADHEDQSRGGPEAALAGAGVPLVLHGAEVGS